MFNLPVRIDVSEFSEQARDRMRHLVSESMEARMQSREALLRLKSTVQAIRQLHAGRLPGGGDRPDGGNGTIVAGTTGGGLNFP